MKGKMVKMDNKKIILSAMLARYCKLSATNSYIFGFIRNGAVYSVRVENAETILSEIVILGSASKNQGYSIRFRPNKKQQEIILANASQVEILCSAEYLEEVKIKYGNNRGMAFEVLSAQRFNGKLNKAQNTRFTDCGDMNIDGIEYQAKFGSNFGAATFTNEKTLDNLEKVKG